MRLSKNDAAAKLGISIKTLDKKLKAGLIPFEKLPDTVRNGFRGNARVWVFLPDPVPVAPVGPGPARVHDVRPAPQYDDGPVEASVADSATHDRDFAERYLAGEVPDSLGNYYCGTAPSKSLLGPNDMDREGPAPDLQAHMDSRLLATSGPATRHGFDRGLSDEQYSEAMAGWRRLRRGPSMSEQRERQERAAATIRACFDFARGRGIR